MPTGRFAMTIRLFKEGLPCQLYEIQDAVSRRPRRRRAATGNRWTACAKHTNQSSSCMCRAKRRGSLSASSKVSQAVLQPTAIAGRGDRAQVADDPVALSANLGR
jgi:hypothetical protein